MENRLLAALPCKDRQHLVSGCEPVDLVHGNVICELGEIIPYVYFPINSFISLMMPIDSDRELKVGLIGNEGMLGIPIMLRVNVAPFHAMVQGAGSALRIAAPLFLHKLEQSPALQQHMNRYIYVLMSQLAQTAACNRFHVVEERLARLLLMIHDRAHSEKFHITQESLAQMLGVRRVGVTKAASLLQKKNLISYSRGDINIRNIIGLEAASCRCYQADKESYNRTLHC
jgi:CRP-like cAMP-binding protein